MKRMKVQNSAEHLHHKHSILHTDQSDDKEFPLEC